MATMEGKGIDQSLWFDVNQKEIFISCINILTYHKCAILEATLLFIAIAVLRAKEISRSLISRLAITLC